MGHKYCVVPQCNSTITKTPEKMFVCIPKNKTIRKKWLKLARRNPKDISPNSSAFMCEDHFNIEKDIANYMKYKLGFTQKLILAEKAVPTKFHCQEDRKSRMLDSGTTRKAFQKRRRIELITECLQSHSAMDTHSQRLEKDNNVTGMTHSERLEKDNKEVIEPEDLISTSADWSIETATEPSKHQLKKRSSGNRCRPANFFVPINIQKIKQEVCAKTDYEIQLDIVINNSRKIPNILRKSWLKTQKERIKRASLSYNHLENDKTSQCACGVKMGNSDNVKAAVLEDVNDYDSLKRNEFIYATEIGDEQLSYKELETDETIDHIGNVKVENSEDLVELRLEYVNNINNEMLTVNEAKKEIESNTDEIYIEEIKLETLENTDDDHLEEPDAVNCALHAGIEDNYTTTLNTNDSC